MAAEEPTVAELSLGRGRALRLMADLARPAALLLLSLSRRRQRLPQRFSEAVDVIIRCRPVGEGHAYRRSTVPFGSRDPRLSASSHEFCYKPSALVAVVSTDQDLVEHDVIAHHKAVRALDHLGQTVGMVAAAFDQLSQPLPA